jgi:iron complex outermembrane receptor protein
LGNPQLSREKSIKFDAGLSWQRSFDLWLREWRWELTYFENHVDDLIQLELANGLARANNLGQARIRGLEAVARFKLFDFLELSQNYTWQLPRDLVSGVNGRLVGRPEHEANLVIAFKKGPFFISTGLNYIDKQYLDRLNTQVLRHRSRWDAQLSYRFRKKIHLGLEAKNILGTQIVDAVGFPLPGRSFMGSVNLKF